MPRVLVIDDEVAIVKIISDLYKSRFNVKVDTAFNGEQALELALQKQYDILCVDYCMPKLNGIDFLKKIKCKDCLNKNSIVLFITAYNPELDIDGKLWDQVYFIKKPFIKDSIVNYTNMAIAANKRESIA